jgi:hypothetical protein
VEAGLSGSAIPAEALMASWFLSCAEALPIARNERGGSEALLPLAQISRIADLDAQSAVEDRGTECSESIPHQERFIICYLRLCLRADNNNQLANSLLRKNSINSSRLEQPIFERKLSK